MGVDNNKLSKRERNRKIKAIYREMEAKKRELGLSAPVIQRGPVFYLVVVVLMALLGGAIIQATGKGGARGRMMDAKTGQAIRSVDALAEALGRYKFHCGRYPTLEEGLEALALKTSKYPGWIGPYIPKMLPDPWKRPYIYELPTGTNDFPKVFSLGPDGKRGTADDIVPDKELFTKPFRDTTWTNDWVPFYKRGYIIVPSRDKTEVDESSENLRGVGRVSVKETSFGEGGQKISSFSFFFENDEKAEILAGKFLYDLYRGNEVKYLDGIHEAKSGTSFSVVRDGKNTVIFSALNRGLLKSHLNKNKIKGGFVETAKCPEWMKAFGWGLYGSGGLENFHDWMAKAKARQGIDSRKDRSDLDPREDYRFLQEMGGMFVDNWMQNQKFDNSDGITSPFIYSRIKLAKDFNIPMAYRVYSSAGEGDYSWFFHRFASRMEKPAKWMQNGWLRYYLHTPHLSWFDPEIWEYAGARVKQQMECFGKDGTVRNWMHPAGELAHQPWYDWHSDYSSYARNAWVKYLQDKGCTIEDVSEMYNRAKCPFKSWSEVPVPEFATFAGLSGMVVDFYGTWQTSLPDETSWTDFPNHPGNWDFLSLYLEKGERAGTIHGDWRHPKQKEYLRKFRRVFSWAPLDSKIYFYFFPMSGEHLRHKVSFNGGKVFTVGNWCAIDVTDQLKSGENTLDILLEGSIWNGRAFLSTEKPEMYPNMSMARCKLWSYWHDWRINAKAARCEAIFDAMRQADPNAPIEFMAPMRFGQRITNRLMYDWGGFSHFTGEGVWFFPWYKRYAKLYGYQGTSELAGPYDTVAEAQRSSLRVFLAGLDMHKPVFLTQVYSRNPEVRKWWISHKDMLARVGTYDIDLKQPQILIYRRTEILESTFPNPFPVIDEKVKKSLTPWNYDIGRGSLQSIGQSYLYIDDDGIEDGKMDRFKVMVDCGNEIIHENHVELIKKWVEKGGVFIAYPFTGRSSPLKAKAWPIANLTGSIIKENAVRPGYVPKVVFPKEGRFFPSFAGQTLHGAQRRLHENDFALQITNDDSVSLLKWEDGRIAATARRIGKGMVIHLGSLFWRGSEDVRGIWNPQDEFERTFLRELFAACGQASAIVETDNRLVLAQPYRSKNGMNLVAVLCNFNETNALNNAGANGNPNMDVTLKMKTVTKPRRLVAYGGDGITNPAFTFTNGVTTVKLPLPMQEVKVVEAECYTPCDMLSHWWEVIQEELHELKKPKLKLAKYDEGKWKDRTQDIKEGWNISSFDADLKCDDIPLDCLQFWGWPEKKGAVAKKKFDIADSSWLSNGGKTRLVIGSWVGRNFLSPATVKLNGETLVEKTDSRYIDFDVTAKLKPAGNEIEIVFEDGEKFTGMNGSVFIYNRAKPEFSIDILKGEGKARLISGDNGKDAVLIDVPGKWEGEYSVRFYMEGTRDVPKGVKVEDRFTRKHHHNFGNITDIDITGLLKYGKENRIDIGADSPAEHQDKTSVKNLTVMRLDFYKK